MGQMNKDREKTVPSSEPFVKPAMIQLILHRLRPSDVGRGGRPPVGFEADD